MTLFGKLLVLLDVLLSFLAMTWALAVYTNNIDWSDSPPKGEKPAGVLNQKKTELRDALAGIPPAEASWIAARTDLMEDESQVAGTRAFYAAELKHARSEALPEDMKAARAVKLDADTFQPVLEGPRVAMEQAKDRAGKPLGSVSYYARESEDTAKKLSKVQEDYRKDIDEDAKLTDLLVGTPEKKGLQQRLIDERAKREGVIAELRLVRPLWINAAVDWELIGKRKEGLDERIDELVRYLRKRHKVDVVLGKR
jgi:hypothetical protein